MTRPLFHIQNADTGLYMAAIPSAHPFTPRIDLAAAYGLEMAARLAEQLAGGKPAAFRLVAIESVDFLRT